MSESQEVERIFKQRQQYKECRLSHNSSAQEGTFATTNSSGELPKVTEISELIKKFKS